jgi:hypothetical protein
MQKCGARKRAPELFAEDYEIVSFRAVAHFRRERREKVFE